MKLEYKGEQLECIALALRRVFAEQILSGEKTMETRNSSVGMDRLVYDREAKEHNDRICAKLTLKQISNMTPEQFIKWGLVDDWKPIKAIHFFDRFKGAWDLYVAVDEFGFTRLLPESMAQNIPAKYDFHEYDGFAKEYAEKVANEEWTLDDVPCIWWFHIAEVISSRGLEKHITDVNPTAEVNITED